MNHLPNDLKKVISLYLDYRTFSSYFKLVPNLENKEILLDVLFKNLHFPRQLLLQIWNSPEHFYNLTPYQNYVRVLAYFGYILPESDIFLSQEQCYSLAAKLGDKAMTYKFGKLLGQKESVIDKFMENSLGQITQVMCGKSNGGVLVAIKNGVQPNLKKVKFLSSINLLTTIIYLATAIIYKREKILDNLIEELDADEATIEPAFFVAYCITDNLKELSLLFPNPNFPDYIEDNINSLLHIIELNNPHLSFPIIEWIYSKLTFINLFIGSNFIYSKLLTLFYFHGRDIAVGYDQQLTSSTFPIDLYIALRLGAKIPETTQYLEKLSRAKKPKKFSLELANIIVDQFLKSQNPTEVQLAQKIIKKLK